MRLKSMLALVFLLVAGLAAGHAYAAPVNIDLGTAANFAVLAGSGITNATPGTMINGDVGSSPTPAVTGLTPGDVNGHLYLISDPATAQAQSDLTVAYNAAAGAPVDTNLTGQDLGGMILAPGVYSFASSAGLTGILTLDGQGDPNAQWIFQIGSTLTVATDSSVSLINGASARNAFWQIGSSATILAGSDFAGNMLAQASITLGGGGTLYGRALARTGAVTIASAMTVVRPSARGSG